MANKIVKKQTDNLLKAKIQKSANLFKKIAKRVKMVLINNTNLYHKAKVKMKKNKMLFKIALSINR